MDLDELIELLEELADEHGGHLWVEGHEGTLLREKDVELVREDGKPTAVQIR